MLTDPPGFFSECKHFTLRKKCRYSELFWPAFFPIRTRITPNTDTFYTVLLSSRILLYNFYGTALALQQNPYNHPTFLLFPEPKHYQCYRLIVCHDLPQFSSICMVWANCQVFHSNDTSFSQKKQIGIQWNEKADFLVSVLLFFIHMQGSQMIFSSCY